MSRRIKFWLIYSVIVFTISILMNIVISYMFDDVPERRLSFNEKLTITSFFIIVFNLIFHKALSNEYYKYITKPEQDFKDLVDKEIEDWEDKTNKN